MYTLVVYTPLSHADIVRKAIADAGGGASGNYEACSFASRGIGRFRPLKGSKPFIGKEGRIEEVEEERLECTVADDRLSTVVQAIRSIHPYEEPAICVVELASENGT